MKSNLVRIFLLVVLVGLFTVLAPLEQTLGSNARIVYLHGAWVWVALIGFVAAALSGSAGLLLKKAMFHHWSRAMGWVGLGFWITFLPMSMYVMQANWNGLFLQEPRFRIPLNYAVVGLLMQIGLALLNRPLLTSAANTLFGIALLVGMSGMDTVLHPESPIFSSNARGIQLFFLTLVLLLSSAAWQIAELLVRWQFQHVTANRVAAKTA